MALICFLKRWYDMRNISEIYKKSLVTVSMGFRTEDDIEKNGLEIFTKNRGNEVFNYVKNLYEKGGNVLALKIEPIGYKSEHIVINSEKSLYDFKKNIDIIFDNNNEIWGGK